MRSPRSILALVTLVCAASSHAQVTMTLSANGEKLGTAVLRMNVDPSGRITQTMDGTVDYKGVHGTQHESMVCDRTGRPIQKTNGYKGRAQSESTLSIYEAKRVRVSKTVNGKTTQR